MRGKHIVVVRNSRVQFTLELERNLTVIRGDSATGKTTLIGMLQDYEAQGRNSGVNLSCDKRCCVLNGIEWEERLGRIHDSIVFVDEGNPFVSSRAFAQAIVGTSNYYVLVTRESLYQLPYSVDAVLELRKTTSRQKCTYNRTYPYYGELPNTISNLNSLDIILTEDSNSGYQMFSRIAQEFGKTCESAGGKSNIHKCLEGLSDQKVLVIADGAAFGAEMEKVYQYLRLHDEKATLYLPESFEWLILKAGIITGNNLEEILSNPSEYIESEKYISWEQFFTALLVLLANEQESYKHYNKRSLTPFYLQQVNVQKLLSAMDAE